MSPGENTPGRERGERRDYSKVNREDDHKKKQRLFICHNEGTQVPEPNKAFPLYEQHVIDYSNSILF